MTLWPGTSIRPTCRPPSGAAAAAREVAKREKKGQAVEPVAIDGRTIARTFWGKAWCDHLESYSDYANRLPRGRTYVRNGSVLHLGVGAGRIDALVQGSELYEVAVTVAPLARRRAGRASSARARGRSTRWSSCSRASSPTA